MALVGRSWLLLVGFILFYVIYLLFGALIFSTIERPMEDKLRHDMEVLKKEFLNQSCVSAASLENFLFKVLAANKYGVFLIRNASATSNWDLASSMFFANTLVTTVGECKQKWRKFGEETPEGVFAHSGASAVLRVTVNCKQAEPKKVCSPLRGRLWLSCEEGNTKTMLS